MLKLDVTADVAKATEHLSDVAAKRIPNAAAKALTRTAFDARDAVRDGLPERFNLRRPWVSRGIGVTPAKPSTRMADVWSRDRFMALQESGGTKTGKLAIPGLADGPDRTDPRHPKAPVAWPAAGEEERLLSGR